MPAEFKPQTLSDSVFAFDAGMNVGVMPLLLPKNQLAMANNCTVRGTFVTHRPSMRKMTLNFSNDPVLESNFKTGKWQGGGYYRPDNGNGSLMSAISGRLFQANINGNVATVAERPVAADPTYPNPVTQTQAWLWQSEKWCIYNDGLSQPIFFDGTTSVRSNYGVPSNFTTTNTDPITIPAIGGSVLAITVASAASMVVGDIITIQYHGTWQVLQIVGNDVDLLNLTATPVGYVIAAGHTLSWTHIGNQLPPGRMGVYGMGRNWMSLIDGKQFVASDLVGGSSGTQAENYRDAVLNITENLYLAGGGNFTVPGNLGDIKAMRFTATLDASLGQGPLQVVTAGTVFSCNAPVDRTTWQDLTNPILTESLITNGGLSQNATINANGDLIFRSVDGIRSLILARRDFNTWGNVPISREVDALLAQDSQSLLPYTSAVVFQNRLLMTVGGVPDDQGVYWRGLIALNFDPISSLRGKAASVYDGLWTGLNVLQLIAGDFDNDVQRCFAFCLNTVTHEIELYEILPDTAAYYDNDTRRIVWEFETPVLDFGQKDPKRREQLRLRDGEIHVDNVLGTVDFEVFYRPDQWPCWVPWHAWSICAKPPVAGNPITANYQPQFRPSMGLGEPSPAPCDATNNRPLREGYTYQVKVRVTGHCRFLGARFAAVTTPQPEFAKMVCERICLETEEAEVIEQVESGMSLVNALEAITQNDGTVVPIITSNQQLVPGGQFGCAPNLTDGKLYQIITQTLNDGTVVPLADQTPHNTCASTVPRVRNMTDGKWYDLKTITLNDGTVVPICDQTAHNTPTGP